MVSREQKAAIIASLAVVMIIAAFSIKKNAHRPSPEEAKAAQMAEVIRDVAALRPTATKPGEVMSSPTVSLHAGRFVITGPTTTHEVFGAGQRAWWYSNRPAVASVNSEGKIVPAMNGLATLCAQDPQRFECWDVDVRLPKS